MGIFMVIYQFRDHLPSIEEVERTVSELVGEKVIREGTLTISDAEKTEKAKLIEMEKLDQSHSRLFSSANATLRTTGKRETRRKLHVRVRVSLRESELIVMGNDIRLAKATCEALKLLGGTEWQPLPKTSRKHVKK
jgi:hypothetical protein